MIYNNILLNRQKKFSFEFNVFLRLNSMVFIEDFKKIVWLHFPPQVVAPVALLS